MRILPVMVALLLGPLVSGAQVPDGPDGFFDERFQIWLGGFFPDVDSKIRLDTPDGFPGDTIDFEDTLGLDDGKSVLFGGARWRIAERHQLEGEIIQLNRSSFIGAITDPLLIGKHEVQVGASIESTFDVAIARLTYGFRIVNREKSALNLKAGVHVARLETLLRLSGNVFKDGVPISDEGLSFVDEGSDLTWPLPHLGLSWAYAFTPRIGMRVQGLAFAIKINEFKGTLLDLGVDAQWYPWTHVGFGAGFRYFEATLSNDEKDDLLGKITYEYFGPVIYATFSF